MKDTVREPRQDDEMQCQFSGRPAPSSRGGGMGGRSSPLSAALSYASSQWPVLPCRPGGKEPLTKHGLHDSTTDEAAIARWWRRWPSANVGLRTGVAFDVLDVDTKASKPGLESMERLWRSGLLTGVFRIVRTPTGGLHLYFAPSSEGNHSIAKAGIDFRGVGGYVVAPPSHTPVGPYELLDEADPAGARPFDWAAAKTLLDPEPPRRLRGRPCGAGIQRLADWVGRREEGERNRGLYWAARRAVEANVDPTPLVDAGVRTGLSLSEAERTVRSAMSGTP